MIVKKMNVSLKLAIVCPKLVIVYFNLVKVSYEIVMLSSKLVIEYPQNSIPKISTPST